jgi:GntR family transcriptional regulator/MocR family aminotransferase
LKWFSDRCGPVIEQLALADWLENGILERHIRKMRRVYAQRRTALTAALQQHFGDRVQVQGVPAGMHILANFDLGLDESVLVRRAQEAGIKVYPAGPSYTGARPVLPGLILGFGHLPAGAITRGIEALARVWVK